MSPPRKPKFDPSQPYEPVANTKPKFDPSQPYEPIAPAAAAAPTEPQTPSFQNWLERGVAPGEAVPWYDPIVRGANQVVTFGNGDEAAAGGVAAYKTLADMLPESMGGAPAGQERGFWPLYREQRGEARTATARAASERPWLYAGGTTAGTLATLPFAMAARGANALSAAASEVTPLAQYLRTIWGGMKAGTAFGAAAGLGTTDADFTAGNGPTDWRSAFSPEAVRGLKDVGTSAGEGMFLGGTIPAALGGIGWVGNNVVAPAGRIVRGGFVKPTPAALRLMDKGADLTLGRMDPNSFVGRAEELAVAKAHGGGIDEMRTATDNGVRRLLINEAGAPGEPLPNPEATTAQQIEHIKQGYTAAYDKALDGVMVDPSKYEGKGAWRGVVTDETVQGAARRKGAFEMAAEDRGIDATEKDRTRALGWLKDQATMLLPRKSGPDAGLVEATNLQSLRTAIGKEIDALEGSDAPGSRARMLIYRKARSFVDEVLHEGLPPEASDRLRAVDRSWANKLALEAAGSKAFKAGDEVGGGNFSADQLLTAIGKIGGTPEFEQTARDAHNVLTAKYRPTGIQSSALDILPGSKYAAQPLAQMLNTSPSLRDWALNPKYRPGIPAKVGSALANMAEGIGSSPTASTATLQSLYDMLYRPAMPPMGVGLTEADKKRPAWAASP